MRRRAVKRERRVFARSPRFFTGRRHGAPAQSSDSAYGNAENPAWSYCRARRTEGRPGTDTLKPDSPGQIDRNGDLRVVADEGPRRADDLAGRTNVERFADPQLDRVRLVLCPGVVDRHKEGAEDQHNDYWKTVSPHVPPLEERGFPKSIAWPVRGQSFRRIKVLPLAPEGELRNPHRIQLGRIQDLSWET